MTHAVQLSSTDQILYFRAYNQDTNGNYTIPNTGVDSSTPGLTLSVKRVGATAISIGSITDKAADDTAHSDGAIRNFSGNLYTIDAPDSVFATQVPSVVVCGEYTSGIIEGDSHPIVGYDGTQANLHSNIKAVSDDTTAADNLESMYDGTGYTAATAPASRSHVEGRTLPSGDYFNSSEDNVTIAPDGLNLINLGYSNYYAVVERSASDTNNVMFQWTASGEVPSGQVSINSAAYVDVSGAISYLRTEGSKHYFTLAYSSFDRPSVEGTARYKMMDSSNTRYFNLKVGGENTYDPQAALGVINQGVQKSSKLIPHTTEI